MPYPICTTCGTQYAESDRPAAECPICQDERQFVGWGGQQWRTLDELRQNHQLTGVRFVEVLMGDGVGWDTHRDNFPRTRALSSEADLGLAALIEDLKERGRLDSTLVIWIGEFGRTPQVTSGGGRNHWAHAWSSVLAGGGIRGGQVIGRTAFH